MQPSSWRIAVLVLGLIAFVSGCGGTSTGRCAVSGTLKGLDAQSGIISLVPEPGTDGPSVRTTFAKGRYSFSTTDGPKPGRYVVFVWVTSPSPSPSENNSIALDELKARMTENGPPRSQLLTVPKANKAVVDISLTPLE